MAGPWAAVGGLPESWMSRARKLRRRAEASHAAALKPATPETAGQLVPGVNAGSAMHL